MDIIIPDVSREGKEVWNIQLLITFCFFTASRTFGVFRARTSIDVRVFLVVEVLFLTLFHSILVPEQFFSADNLSGDHEHTVACVLQRFVSSFT